MSSLMIQLNSYMYSISLSPNPDKDSVHNCNLNRFLSKLVGKFPVFLEDVSWSFIEIRDYENNLYHKGSTSRNTSHFSVSIWISCTWANQCLCEEFMKTTDTFIAKFIRIRLSFLCFNLRFWSFCFLRFYHIAAPIPIWYEWWFHY